MVRRLLHAGAEVDLKNNLRHTTLYYDLRNLDTSSKKTVSAVMEVLRMLLATVRMSCAKTDADAPVRPMAASPLLYLSTLSMKGSLLHTHLSGH